MQHIAFLRCCFGLTFVGLILLALPTSAFAATITVDSTATALVVDGNCTLREAILAANNDAAEDGCAAGNGEDLVVLGEGAVYTFDETYDDLAGGNALPGITGEITIEGNGATLRRNLSYTACDLSVLDERFRLLHITASGVVTLQNLTLENGCAHDGGAIHNLGELTLIDVEFIRNQAIGGGAGIYSIDESKLDLQRVAFTENKAASGAGLFTYLSTVTMTETTFFDNRGVDGGGIFLQNSMATIANARFADNQADGTGGGLYSTESTVNIANSDFVGNRASGGGGLSLNTHSAVTIQSTRIVSNSVEGDGGAMFTSESQTTLLNSEVLSNTAKNRGGGFFLYSGVTLKDSLVAFNVARDGDGGGIFGTISVGTLIIEDSGISHNTSGGAGGGISSSGSPIEITRSKILHNRAQSGGGVFGQWTTTITILDSEIAGNNATGEAGGLLNGFDGVITLTSSEISSNEAATGAGFHAYSGSITTVSNTAILSNTASNFGGGFHSDGTVTLRQSQVRANQAKTGGGWYSYAGSILVEDSVIAENVATVSGGGAANGGNTATILRSQISSNIASVSGGALYNVDGSEVTVADSTFVANEALYGGGLATYGAKIALSNSQLLDNVAGEDGGAMNNSSATVNVTDSLIRLNRAGVANDPFNPGYGGGIYTEYGTLEIAGTRIEENSAINGGGLYAALPKDDYHTVVKIEKSDILSNTAKTRGGAIYKYGPASFYEPSTLTVTGSRIVGNQAAEGGGLFNKSADPATITQSCIVGNLEGGALLEEFGDYISVPVDAKENWWGAADGPGGIGPGSGDAISKKVAFEPFLTAPILGCPLLSEIDPPTSLFDEHLYFPLIQP